MSLSHFLAVFVCVPAWVVCIWRPRRPAGCDALTAALPVKLQQNTAGWMSGAAVALWVLGFRTWAAGGPGDVRIQGGKWLCCGNHGDRSDSGWAGPRLNQPTNHS